MHSPACLFNIHFNIMFHVRGSCPTGLCQVYPPNPLRIFLLPQFWPMFRPSQHSLIWAPYNIWRDCRPWRSPFNNFLHYSLTFISLVPCFLGLHPRTSARFLPLALILRRSRTGTVWFYTSTSNKRAARPKLYTESLTRDLKLMYSRFTLVRISINL